MPKLNPYENSFYTLDIKGHYTLYLPASLIERYEGFHYPWIELIEKNEEYRIHIYYLQL